jgi:hypothetical protein
MPYACHSVDVMIAFRVFDNKEQMLDEERRLLNQGVHPDLQRQMDEIQQSYDARRQTIECRFELNKQSIDMEHHFLLQQDRQSFYVCVSLSCVRFC